MRSVEVEGESIDDAIGRALAELGISRDRASIEILNDASRGILGFGARKARVRATVRAPLSASLAAVERSTPGVSRETRTPRIDAVSPPSRRQPTVAEAGAARVLDRVGLAPNVGRAGAEPGSASASPPRPAPSAPPTGELAMSSRALLLELLSHMGIDCEVSSQPPVDGAAASLAVQGASSALLIGKRGQTLDAIEYLLNRMVIREAGSSARIEVDIEGYRARREENLASIAHRMADKVRQTGRPATVDLMSPRDRRIVHMALKNEDGVVSRSQGEGFLRKLVILPAGKRRSGSHPSRDGE